MKIWDSGEYLSAVQSFKAYLFNTARNHTLNTLKNTARSELALGEVLRGYAEERNLTEEDLLSTTYLAFINGILNTLPKRTREIFSSCLEQGYSYPKYFASEFQKASLKLDAQDYIIVQEATKRWFDAKKDYLWPLPTRDLRLNANLTRIHIGDKEACANPL